MIIKVTKMWDAYIAADKRLRQAKRLWWHGRRTATTEKALVKRKAISQAAWDEAAWATEEAARQAARARKASAADA